MSGKPQVFKLGGAWVWQCHHNDERRFSGYFPGDAWRNPWDTCLVTALAHSVEFHADVEVIDP